MPFNDTMKTCTRRNFLITAAGAAGAAALHRPAQLFAADAKPQAPIPSYLKGYQNLYRTDPRAAARQWFREAKFGLFMHYGLYSLLGSGEWVQHQQKIPVNDYAKLKDRFRAEKFDADFITDLALAAEMKYVNITTRHHDSFCLWDTKETDFKSTNSPARRDLVAELAEQCRKKRLGLCLYYSHGRDWRHPHAPNNDEWGGNARPGYENVETGYAMGATHDLAKYVDFVAAQVAELLTNYGPIAAIWLDGIGVPLSRRNRVAAWHCQELYDLIHRLQPQVLISYKQGLLGTEDFMAPERHWRSKTEKPLEICDTLQPKGWGYKKAEDGNHKSPDDVIQMLGKAAAISANLLLNTGPLADGSIQPEDVSTLKQVGKRIREQGFPTGTSGAPSEREPRKQP
ncbi:MAG: alpha-L-fucosidase [Verrucomicrobiota bacterium]